MDYFFIEECPLKEACSQGAWKKASCWGWTSDEARTQLVRHLMKSGNHQLSKEDAEGIADDTEVVCKPWEEPPPSKRSRLQSPRRTDDTGGASSSGSTDDTTALMQVITALAQKRSLRDPFPGVASPPSGPPPSSIASRGPPGTVTLRTDIAKAAVDSMARAIGSARHAQRLCEAAAVGFGQEAEAIADARRAFMTAFGFEP